jgi:hypothetical protein
MSEPAYFGALQQIGQLLRIERSKPPGRPNHVLATMLAARTPPAAKYCAQAALGARVAGIAWYSGL